MKRIIIICEGQTEVEFCKDVLCPYFIGKEILIQTPLIKKSGGGIVKWSILKKQIENHLKQDQSAIVTTFIDFYGIKDKHFFPSWEAAKAIVGKNDKMTFIEGAMKDEIAKNLNHRFLPYVQLHEFEGLLFNEISVFESQIPEVDFSNKPELVRILQQFPNPELINDTPENAPSYRLSRLIRGYNKVIYGSILAEAIGLTRIRNKSPRFNGWIDGLEEV